VVDDGNPTGARPLADEVIAVRGLSRRGQTLQFALASQASGGRGGDAKSAFLPRGRSEGVMCEFSTKLGKRVT